MLNLKKILLSWIKKILSDSHSAVIGIIFGLLIASSAGVYIFFQEKWILLKSIVQSPVLLWQAMLLALLVMAYIHLKTLKNHSRLAPDCHFFFESDGYKWKTQVGYKGNVVSGMPFCIMHDKRLIHYENSYACPDKENNHCKSVIKVNEYPLLKSIAESEAEHLIRKRGA